jgi:hypothetical protein
VWTTTEGNWRMRIATASRNGVSTHAERGVTVEKVFVTPELALEWLDRNHNNRNITGPRVDLFVKLIRDGKWCLTHQGVAFYDDGDLADGQTRLTAIVKAGVPVWMFVTRGLPRASIHAIDGARPRNVRDVLHFLGMSLSQHHVAVTRLLWMEYDLQRRDNAAVWDKNVVDTVVFTRFASAVMEPVQFAMPASKARGLSHSCCVAAVASAWFTQDKAKLLRFKELVASGAGADSDEQAAIRLRDYLLTTNLLSAGSGVRQELFIRCCTALRAFLEGRPLSKLYCRPDSVFPIPDLG